MNNENKELMINKPNEVVEVNDTLIIEYMNAFGIAKNLKDEQKKQFIEVAKAFQLNPFKREIHCIAYNGTLSLIVGYEVYLKRAERSGKLAGWKVWAEGSLSDKSLKAICEIHRKDWGTPLIHEVYYSEYMRNTQIWREKPYTMIKKVAIAQAFRLAFPDELGGIPYTAEEQWEAQVIEKLPAENNHNVVKQDIPIAVDVQAEPEQEQKQEEKPAETEPEVKPEPKPEPQLKPTPIDGQIPGEDPRPKPKPETKQEEKELNELQKKVEEKQKQFEKEKKKDLSNCQMIKELTFPLDYSFTEKETKTGTNKGQKYWVIDVKLSDKKKMKLYLFDTKVFEILNKAGNKKLDFYYTEKEKSGKVFYELVKVEESLPF